MSIHTQKGNPRRHAPHWTKESIQQVQEWLKQGVPLERICRKTERNMAQIRNLIKSGRKIMTCLSCHQEFITNEENRICKPCKREQGRDGKSAFDGWGV